jgi:hypothetical protein
MSEIKSHLKLMDVNEIMAGNGELPDLPKTNKVRQRRATWVDGNIFGTSFVPFT